MELIEKYKRLSEREQYLTIAFAVVVIVGAFYWLIWSPLNTSLARNSQQITVKQELLSYVVDSAVKLNTSNSANGNRKFSGSLTQAVNSSASRSGISITRMQPQGEELQVWIDNTNFNSLMSWLDGLEKQGIKILIADIAESDSLGFVKVRRLQLGK